MPGQRNAQRSAGPIASGADISNNPQNPLGRFGELIAGGNDRSAADRSGAGDRWCFSRPPYFSCHLLASTAAARLARLLVRLEVGVPLEAPLIEPQKPAGFFIGDPRFADRQLHRCAKLAAKSLGAELDVVEHLADGVALDHRLEHDLPACRRC